MLKAKIEGLNKRIRRKAVDIGKKAVDIGVASHIINSHKDYQKFIITGMPRSGSNFLTSSLRSRKNIITYGELFNEKSRMRGVRGSSLSKIQKNTATSY